MGKEKTPKNQWRNYCGVESSLFLKANICDCKDLQKAAPNRFSADFSRDPPVKIITFSRTKQVKKKWPATATVSEVISFLSCKFLVFLSHLYWADKTFCYFSFFFLLVHFPSRCQSWFPTVLAAVVHVMVLWTVIHTLTKTSLLMCSNRKQYIKKYDTKNLYIDRDVMHGPWYIRLGQSLTL